MRPSERVAKLLVLISAFGLAAYFAITFRAGGLWRGLEPALAVSAPVQARGPYDLTRLEAVNETLKTIRDKYVDPSRVHPREMFLSALNYVQRDTPQVIVLYEDGQRELTVRVNSAEKQFRVDNIQGHWDVSNRLREVFAFLQLELQDNQDVELRDIEYAACNGMLHTLDPHSVFLSPEAYREMNLSTSGAFGGLGIVISIRDQMLTVMNPMKGTPAERAGLRRLDRITKINNESTLNMPLDDAVKRLRGEPGTKVVVWVQRENEGWRGSRPFELTRERIKVPSVEHQLLEGNIGYLRLKQFQSTTSVELDQALATLHRKSTGLKGLVLDLRSNPGGLLEQAWKVADKWLRSGVIVSTVGAAEAREEKVARKEGNEPDYPIVVLVNGSSASASEIVAGALKNHDRALVVGQQTFGKGSVQLVFPDVTRDRAALKLTIAQYLTPGDVSIQGVGITPDIELDPMTVDPLEMDLFVVRERLRESDLSQRLSNDRARDGQKPLELVRYYLSQAERQELRERGGDIDDEMTPDFTIKFARELVTHMPEGQKRLEQFRAAKGFIDKASSLELAKVSAELQKLGIDWSDAPGAATGLEPEDLEITVETDKPGAEVMAGGAMSARVTVKNTGSAPVYRLRATTKSDSGYFNNKELVFGKIEPGQSRTATAPFGFCDIEGRKPGSSKPVPPNAPRVCKIPRDAVTRADGIRFQFDAAGMKAPPEAELRTTIRGLERPVFSYAYQIADDRAGNGDGRVQRGEKLTMYLTVKNIGRGKAYEAQANIANLSGDGLLLHDGRFELSSMEPGDVRQVAFTFDVEPQLADNEATIELTVVDRELRELVTEKVKIPIEAPLELKAATGPVKVSKAGAELFDAPVAGGQAFGRLKPNTALKQLAKVGEYVKVDLGLNRFGFVSAKSVSSGGTPQSAPPSFEHIYSHAPPIIEVAPSALHTRDSQIRISGVATDGARLLDVYIFVGTRKVFYKSNEGAEDPSREPFETEVPLRPGINVINVFARESADTIARKTLVVRRDGPNGELLSTPRTEQSFWDNGEGLDDDL